MTQTLKNSKSIGGNLSRSKSPLQRNSSKNKKKAKFSPHESSFISRMDSVDRKEEKDAYKRENRILKNRLKSMMAIKQVQELNTKHSGIDNIHVESELTDLQDIQRYSTA